MELRYQWFDYLFKGRAKPELLKDHVNYQVMGANVWKHAPSLEAMANDSIRFFLTAAQTGTTHRLSEKKAAKDTSIGQRIDFADRSDADRVVPLLNVVDSAVDSRNGLVFVSEPFQKPTEISGLFSGRLEFTANKKDFDFKVQFYEQMPNGSYFLLSWYVQRASYINDRTRRHLLTPGKRQQLVFRTQRSTSRQVQAGSRLVAVISILKDQDQQIDYGTGKDVSDEWIADAKEPLLIKWYSTSFLDTPIWR